MNYFDWYERISAPFRSEAAIRAINALDRALVYLFAAAYVITLAILAFSGDGRFWRVLIVPAVTFAIVSVARVLINEPRPYELYPINPIIHKETSGRSLPSRHLASAVIIAFALTWLNTIAGVVAFVACVAISFTRIIGGVHFPKDILASLIVSLVCGIIGFIVIP